MSQQRTAPTKPRDGEPRSIAFLLAEARSGVRKAVGAQAAHLRLTPQQFWALVGLAESGPMVLGALAARSCMDAPTASRVVEALVRRGLVAAEPDAADRRRTTLTLTAEGAAVAAEAGAIAARVRASVVEGFTAAEEAELRALLQRVIGNFAGRG